MDTNEANKKREAYLSWDGYFMFVAFISSLRSKDPNTRHGACIVNKDFKIVGTGYNGFPVGCPDDDFPWNRDGEYKNTKIPYVVHAELNAILNANGNVKNGCMYLYSEKGYYPCENCAKAIIQSRITDVVLATAITEDTDKYDWGITQRMFASSNVNIRITDYINLEKDMNILIQESSNMLCQINMNILEGKVKTNIEV